MEVRVDVTTTGAHDQPLLRREAHRSIHALAIPDRGCTASIPKMCRYELGFLDRFANPFGRLQNDVMMAGTMESIPTNSIFFVVFVWNRVVKCVSRQSLVKRRVENCYLLFVRK